MARRCIFCQGDGPLSVDHIWPEWLAESMGASGRNLYKSGTIIEGEAVVAQEFEGLGLQKKVKAVCRKCNNEWMSELEQEVAPFLGSMVRGDGATLTMDEQELLALWTMKTVCVADQLYRPQHRNVRLADAEYVYTHREPPPHSWIWLASVVGDEEDTQVGSHQGFRLPLPGDVTGYAATIVAGALVIQMLGTLVRLDDVIPEKSRAFLVPIQPPHDEFAVWPPGVVLSRAALEQLSAPPDVFA